MLNLLIALPITAILCATVWGACELLDRHDNRKNNHGL